MADEPANGPAEAAERTLAFLRHVQGGGTVEATEWMPDEYRQRLIRFIEAHANSEVMGALPEREWIPRAPSLKRKLGLTAKVQDEVGNGQLLYRIVEDLGKPREQMLQDLIAGRTKYHNVFHYPTKSWADVGVIAWLVDGAAVISQGALVKTSYAPYGRIMKRICWEEAFHLKHGEDICLTLAAGTPIQRDMLQEALTRWWPPVMMFHGPPTPPETDPDLRWRIKPKPNDVLRQEFLDHYVPRIRELGLVLPDPRLRKDTETGRWLYTEPDWAELREIVRGNGPASRVRLSFRRLSYEEGAWVRDAILGRGAAA
ncbi:MAG TPA: 1,2-phenylacetyl-CoA epoxidase subunit PaaA [bacterium]|nr:1,2-phenylacetyl-CoA epoxidase subunit PaaA [bacterium]